MLSLCTLTLRYLGKLWTATQMYAQRFCECEIAETGQSVPVDGLRLKPKMRKVSTIYCLERAPKLVMGGMVRGFAECTVRGVARIVWVQCVTCKRPEMSLFKTSFRLGILNCLPNRYLSAIRLE